MATNRYGLDVAYFRKKFEVLARDLDNYTPQELLTEMARLEGAIRPLDPCPNCGAPALVMFDDESNQCIRCKAIVGVC